MTILSTNELRNRIFNEDLVDRKKLYITPILDLEKQIKDTSASIDLRLGTEFIILRRTESSHIDPFGFEENLELEAIKAQFKNYQSRIHVNFGGKLVLHPHQYIIGVTFEYLRFPLDLSAYVIGRSSWGRLGLIVAMATVIHPGYTGVLTLELENFGEVPITLYPGARICQLVFHEVKENEDIQYEDIYCKTKYIAGTVPAFSKIYEDAEREKLKIFYNKIEQENKLKLQTGKSVV